MTKPNVIISPLIFSHYAKVILIFHKKSEDRKTKTGYHQTCPWGIYAATGPRAWPWLPDAASLSLPPFKTRGWEDRSSLTQFSQFSARLWRRTHESALLCDLERPCACWISLTNGSVSGANCRSHRRRKQEGKWQKTSLYSHIASQLEAIPSPLFPARVSVSSEHTESHLCLFCWGRRVLCFWFDALPAPSCVSQWGIWKKTNKRNQTVRRNDDNTNIWMVIYFSSHADRNINVFSKRLQLALAFWATSASHSSSLISICVHDIYGNIDGGGVVCCVFTSNVNRRDVMQDHILQL